MISLGKAVYSDEQLTQLLQAGEYELESDMIIVVDEEGNVSEIKEPIEMAAEDITVEEPEIIEEDKDAKIAELEDKLAEKEALVLELEAKLSEAEYKFNKLEADFVLKENEVITMSKQTPASLGIIDRPVESSSKPTSTLGVIRNVLNKNK